MKAILVLFALVGADDRDQPRAIVERAIEAQGGLDKLKGASYSRIQGSFDDGGNPFQGEVHSQVGGKLRLNLNFKNEGERILVLVGGKGWLKVKHSVTLDLVVVAADWGYGRRHGRLSNYHLAASDEALGRLLAARLLAAGAETIIQTGRVA